MFENDPLHHFVALLHSHIWSIKLCVVVCVCVRVRVLRDKQRKDLTLPERERVVLTVYSPCAPLPLSPQGLPL